MVHTNWTSIFILNFPHPSHSSQLGEAHTNEVKHDIHPEYKLHRNKDNCIKYGGKVKCTL